jgi:hypothetical protein
MAPLCKVLAQDDIHKLSIPTNYFFLAVLVIVLISNKKNRLFDPPFLAPICPRSECNYSFAGAATAGAATAGAATAGAGGFW